MLYQNLLKNISNIPETKLQQTKAKLLSTCEKYAKIKLSYKHRKIVNELSQRNDIVILKADKGTGVVILDMKKYTKKSLDFLSTNQFQKLNKDPTKTMEICPNLRLMNTNSYFHLAHPRENFMVQPKNTILLMMTMSRNCQFDQ